MQYAFYDDFAPSLKTLYSKGGPFKKAAETVMAMRQKIADGFADSDVFSIAQTHNGESRVPHCCKYELTGRARLVTVRNNGVCMFLFAGDHDSADGWLDKNRGIDFIAKKQGDAKVIEPVFKSKDLTKDGHIRTRNDLGAPDNLFALMPERYRNVLLAGLSEEIIASLEKVNAVSVDDEVLVAVEMIEDSSRQKAVLDVLLHLRAADAAAAKNRVDEYTGEVKRIEELTKAETSQLQSGERVVLVDDIDGESFENFVRNADYQKWMLYLHPSQRSYVDADYSGSVRVSGVSGSGKTCVLIHRALRLAAKHPQEKILVITLNAALAKLIDTLFNASRGELRPKNIVVSSFWEICQNLLLEFEPENKKLYTQETVATNPYAVSEHIDDIWSEFFNCENNNNDAELMYPLQRSLLARKIFPKDYLKQEFDYVRSAIAPDERNKYFDLERTGRVIPLDKPFRTQVVDCLAAWERKMKFVGAIDATAIASALHKHIAQIKPEYRCILVDEVQDFGTLELSIIRRLAKEAENDLFLCGDAAQSVHTKHQDFESAQINIRGGRSMRLQQNYRNSRQILAAAHDILQRNFDRRSKGLVDLELLPPEFANFSSPAPNLLRASSLKEELEYALGHASEVIADSPHKKVCIAFVGYLQRGVEGVGRHLNLPVLNGDINIIEGKVVLSDLEQTKGFEFDTMIILNAHSEILPHPDLPPEESFRDLSKFYVAMTRAKTELIVSYHNSVTDFIGSNQENFAVGNWEDYAERQVLGDWELPAACWLEKKFGKEWDMTGKDFLRTPEAVGLPLNAQEKLLERVTGNIAFEGKQKKQKNWKNIGAFLSDMRDPKKRTFIYLSDEAWHALATHFGRSSGLEEKLAGSVVV
jgi:superfamily I DNA/RNA helicase